jgi:hypothetical protein
LDLAINQLALGHLVDSRRANSNVINRYDTVSKAGIQEGQPCMAKQFQKRERACDDMGGTGQYRVEKPLWQDLR